MTTWRSFQPLSIWPVGPRYAPGNHESAGKRLRGTTRPGSPWLGRMVCQSAWAAARTKNTYLSSQFRRLAARRGKKRAIIAVAHTLIVIAYHLQKNQSNYDDLGGNYFDRIHSDGLKRYFMNGWNDSATR